MKTLLIDLADVRVKICSNYEKYFEFLSVFFDKIKVNDQADKKSDVEINILLSEDSVTSYFEKAKNTNNVTLIGASTLAGKDRIVTIRKIERRKKIALDARVGNESLEVDVYFQYKPRKEFFRQLPFAKPQDEWFFALTYYLIYYPVFWYLEKFRNSYPLHASALLVDEKGVIICGLEGIGKTSLSLKFLQNKNAFFLSDNLVFF